MISAGETFLWTGDSHTRHLYIAMNDSEKFGGKVAVVNLTHASGGSASFVLNRGDHPYITKPSDVNFGDGFVAECGKIEAALRSGLAVQNANMDFGILQNIVARAVAHPAVSREVKTIIRQQWGL